LNSFNELFTDRQWLFILLNWGSEKIYTHIGPSDKFLVLHKAPSGKLTPHSPPLFHQEDAKFSNYNGHIYLETACSAFPF
jgi:hypothetical protein